MSEPREPETPPPTPRTEYVSPALSRLARSQRERSPVRQIADSGPTPAAVTSAWLLELDPRDRLAALACHLRRVQHQRAALTRRRALAQELDRLSRELRPDP